MRCPRCLRRYDDDSLFCHQHGERLVEFIDLERLNFEPRESEEGRLVNDRYRIHGRIGRGGMSEVSLARDLVTGAAVAIKVLDRRHAGDKQTALRLLLEAKAIASIAHENVVEVLEVGLTKGLPYLVMEYLYGESLGEALRRTAVMPLDRGLSVVRQVAAGLAAAHRAGVVHRDVKPDNVFLLGEQGDPYAVKVVDFGFAKVAQTKGVSRYGETLGTIEYMAPEQTVGDPAGPATDVYALGIVMMRLLSGRLPFEGDVYVDVLAKQLGARPPPLELGGGRVERGVAAIVAKALRKDPMNRYATMDALVDDLDRLGTREGPRAAREPDPGTDVYTPETELAERVATMLRRRLGAGR